MGYAQMKNTLPPPPKTKDELWAVICHLRDFTLPELQSRQGVPQTTVYRQVQSLVKSGHLSPLNKGGAANPVRFKVILPKADRPAVDLQGKAKKPSGRQRMWMGMKAKKTFDHREVAFFAQVSKPAARFYCLMLKKAGYLTVLREAGVNDQPELYQFNAAKNTGLHAPTVAHDKKSVFDRNLGKVVWSEEEQ